MEKDILKKPYVALRGIYIFEGAAVYLKPKWLAMERLRPRIRSFIRKGKRL